MSILCMGSLNFDDTYRVEHIAAPAETVSALTCERHIGGKGLNRAVALARAGASVLFAGKTGVDGEPLLCALRECGADVSRVLRDDGESGHAVIQVDSKGQNAIIVFGGANRRIDEKDADRCLCGFGAGDWIVLENEISSLAYTVKTAHEKGMKTVLNPSPVNETIRGIDPACIDLLVLNETEGEYLCGEKEPVHMIRALCGIYSGAQVVLTLGAAGSVSYDGKMMYRQKAGDTKPVDTTAAGDTYLGYLVCELAQGREIYEAMRTASAASEITITRRGAAETIPLRSELCT